MCASTPIAPPVPVASTSTRPTPQFVSPTDPAASSRLYELELRKRMSEQQKLEDAKTDIGWGHQIRSYVLDQSRIKDLRTNFETGNTKAVLDGDIDDFIAASLKQGV